MALAVVASPPDALGFLRARSIRLKWETGLTSLFVIVSPRISQRIQILPIVPVNVHVVVHFHVPAT
jgi:hypothetical protein